MIKSAVLTLSLVVVLAGCGVSKPKKSVKEATPAAADVAAEAATTAQAKTEAASNKAALCDTFKASPAAEVIAKNLLAPPYINPPYSGNILAQDEGDYIVVVTVRFSASDSKDFRFQVDAEMSAEVETLVTVDSIAAGSNWVPCRF